MTLYCCLILAKLCTDNDLYIGAIKGVMYELDINSLIKESGGNYSLYIIGLSYNTPRPVYNSTIYITCLASLSQSARNVKAIL